MRFILSTPSILLILALTHCQMPTERVTLKLQVKNSTNKIPAAKDELFVINFICSITNNTHKTIYIADPESYSIFPHPWIIQINGVDAHFWSGDPTCAPDFSQENIIELEPNETIEKEFDWHLFVVNFSKIPGNYTAKMKYHNIKMNTWTTGADPNKLTQLKTLYSNSVNFEIVQ